MLTCSGVLEAAPTGPQELIVKQFNNLMSPVVKSIA